MAGEKKKKKILRPEDRRRASAAQNGAFIMISSSGAAVEEDAEGYVEDHVSLREALDYLLCWADQERIDFDAALEAARAARRKRLRQPVKAARAALRPLRDNEMEGER